MYGLYGFFFENFTDCTDFFPKIIRIVQIFSENVQIFVRIFSKKFWLPFTWYPFLTRLYEPDVWPNFLTRNLIFLSCPRIVSYSDFSFLHNIWYFANPLKTAFKAFKFRYTFSSHLIEQKMLRRFEGARLKPLSGTQDPRLNNRFVNCFCFSFPEICERTDFS